MQHQAIWTKASGFTTPLPNYLSGRDALILRRLSCLPGVASLKPALACTKKPTEDNGSEGSPHIKSVASKIVIKDGLTLGESKRKPACIRNLPHLTSETLASSLNTWHYLLFGHAHYVICHHQESVLRYNFHAKITRRTRSTLPCKPFPVAQVALREKIPAITAAGAPTAFAMATMSCLVCRSAAS
mmetsp:Transcript_48460/g.122311  ORF Transcript_48460/g.122311 Transcript_48460/m.122311 type:complete len:186 (+) Transcript_48460:97-654(+)